MQINVEILAQGEELLTGQTVDTNSAWLSEQLVELGFKIKRHVTVGDDLTDLIKVLQEIALRADCCLCTGGLGPTVDDLTAEAVSQAFGVPLRFDAEALAQISAFFTHRQREMPETNRKQALLPEGAMRLDNHWGTAPGFALHFQNCWFAFMPGVPHEMRNMFNQTVKPWLQANYAVQPSQAVALKTIALGESTIQQRIKNISLPDTVQLGFCAGADDVKTKLLFPVDFPPATKHELVAQFAQALGEHVYAIDGMGGPEGDIVQILAGLFTSRGQTLALIESITQGLIAAKCLGQPWLLQSSYQQSLPRLAAQYDLSLPTDDLEQTASLLAERCLTASGADLALVQLASSTAQQHSTSVVTLYHALASKQGVIVQSQQVAGAPKRLQNQAAVVALDLIRRYLQGQSLS